MEKELNKITFSMSNAEVITSKEVNDSQFSLLRIKVFSDAVTSHGYKCSTGVLKKCAYTILGKPVLVYYSILKEDFEGHEDSMFKKEMPCGFVPKESKISFETDDNGVTYLVVDAYIWNLYFDYIMDVFERDGGEKDVSVELLIIESEEKENYTEMTDLCFTGLTLLGNNIPPACKGANAEVIKFSEQETDFKKAKEQFEKQLYNSILVNQEPINQEIDKDGSFLYCNNEEQNKEVNMAKDVKEVLENSAETPEVLENAEQHKTTNVSVSEYTDTYDDNGNFVSSESEYHSKSVTTVEEIPDAPEKTDDTELDNTDTEKVENGCGDKKNFSEEETTEKEDVDMSVKCSELEVKCSQLENELTTLKNQYSTLELKCSTLEEYKNNKENEFKLQSVECALNDVVDVLSAEQVSQWRERSLQCSNVDQFKNELKAFAFDLQKQNGVKPIETLRNSIPLVDTAEPTNVWDRLAKQL